MSSNKSVKERLIYIETEMANIKKILDDIKDNHLSAIYTKLDCLEKKLFSRLPLWATLFIAFLSSLCVGLTVYGVMRK